MRLVAAVLAVALLAPVVAVRAARLVRRNLEAIRELRVDDFEQRRLDSYGQCAPRGYGYLRRVLRRFPPTETLPRIHYGDMERWVSLLLPEIRPRREPRVLVGINLDWRQTVERSLPIAATHDGGAAWRFRVPDHDLLTGIRIDVADPASDPRRLEVTLYSTPFRGRVLGRWPVTIAPGAGTGSVRIDPPLERFSVRRGGIDFGLEIAGAAIVSQIHFSVVEVDARDMVVVQQEGQCLTAVDAAFLRAIETDGGAWAEWLADLRRER